MPHHVIKQGLDLPIHGAATGGPVALDPPETVAYDPREFRGIVPKLAVREGDEVREGTPLFHAKHNPSIRVLSPVQGRVREIRRGHRRVITDVVVERTGDGAESFRTWSLDALRSITRQAASEAILQGGLWATLRTRPLDVVADPETVPQSILICGTESGPLQPGPDVLLCADDKDAMQAGVYALRALTDGGVRLTQRHGAAHPAMTGLDGVEEHTFSGPHPSGDPAVQVNYLDPPKGGQSVWWIRAWDLALIGKLLLNGRFPTERIYATVGTGVVQPRLVRTVLGAPLAYLTGNTRPGPQRWIRGSVLTGERAGADRWAGFYARAVHVLPDQVQREMLGWMLPKLGKYSFHRAFLKGFGRPARTFDLRPGVFGGVRAIVPLNVYRQVVATPDIEVSFLFKSIIAGDLEDSIELGLLDLSLEEAALCTYVCPSKVDYDVLLREGLEQYQKEM